MGRRPTPNSSTGRHKLKIPHEIDKNKIREEDDTHGRVSNEQDAHADDLLRVFEMGKYDDTAGNQAGGSSW